MTNNKTPRIFMISLFGDVNNLNSRVCKINRAFKNTAIFITSDFSHAKKKYKEIFKIDKKHRDSTVYLTVPSYSKNLSLGRFYSHLVFSYKLKNYLKNLVEKPDIIICSMPTSSAAYIAARYCKKNNIIFVVDVIDLWPDSLMPLIKYKLVFKILTFPWRFITEKAYQMANYISGESKFYASVAHNLNPTVPWSYTYLGVNIDQANKLIQQSKLNLIKPTNEIWICYGGSLGNSYDFDSVLNAIKYIHEKNISYRMFFVGEGEKRNLIEKYKNENSLNIEITGRMEYMDYLKYLSVSDIGINSFLEGSLVAHSFKFNDYIASNLFILNNLVGETAEMVTKYKIGLNFNKNNLHEILYDVCINWHNYKTYNFNLDKLISAELDTNTIYKELADNILKTI